MSRLIIVAALLYLPTAHCSANPLKLMVFGDSLVAGFGLSPGESFPDRLAHKLALMGYQIEMINAGVSGDTTAGGAARIDWALADHPDAVVLILGGNDMLRGLSPSASEDNLRFILTYLSANDVPVLLCGMLAAENLGADYTQRFNAIYPRLANEFDTFFMPFFLKDVALDPALNQPDGLHPNITGIDIIITNILPELELLLASLSAEKG